MDDDEKLIRGEQAKRALSDPLIKEALGQIERDAVERMLAADIKDDEARYRLVLLIQVIREVRNYLTSVKTTAMEVAKRQGLQFD